MYLQFVPIPDDTATRNVVVDLSLVCPFIGCESGKLKTGVSDSITHDQFFHSNEPKKYKNDPKYYNQRGQQRKVSKNSRYKTAMDYVNGNGQKKVQFVPFIINTTGMIHSDGYNLLVRLAKHAALSRHVADGHKEFLNYYLKIMSITLMKLVARTMFAKSVNNFTATTLHNNAQVRVGNRAVFTEETANRRSTYLGNIHRDDIE